MKKALFFIARMVVFMVACSVQQSFRDFQTKTFNDDMEWINGLKERCRNGDKDACRQLEDLGLQP